MYIRVVPVGVYQGFIREAISLPNVRAVRRYCIVMRRTSSQLRSERIEVRVGEQEVGVESFYKPVSPAFLFVNNDPEHLLGRLIDMYRK